MNKEKSFAIHKNNGFVLNLPNGISISTIFGYGDYCENYNYEPKGYSRDDFSADNLMKRFERIEKGSNDCEIIISCSDEKWLERINNKYGSGGNTVIGYLTMDKWYEILGKCWKWKNKKLTNK